MKNVIYSKFSNERNPRLAIRTDILEDETGRRFVCKVPEFPEGREHVKRMYRWYQELSKLSKGSILSFNHCEATEEGVEFQYLTGETFEEHLLNLQRSEGKERMAEEFLSFLHLVRSLHKGDTYRRSREFEEVFGRVDLPEGSECAKVTDIDLLAGNLLLDGERWTAIDYEWSFDFPIPVNYLLYRIIFYFTEHARRYDLREWDFFGKMGITKEEIRSFEEMETNFQHYVCRGHVPVRDLYEEISPGIFPMEETMGKEALQLFFDFGDGYSEENSLTIPMDNFRIDRTIDLPGGLKSLRVDPGSAAGMIKLDKLSLDGGKTTCPFTLREGAVLGSWIYAGDDDPNLLIRELPNGAHSLTVALTVYPMDRLPMEEVERTAREVMEQRALLREMKNTKVWKAYEKYQNLRKR